jgi:hypothetical protein
MYSVGGVKGWCIRWGTKGRSIVWAFAEGEGVLVHILYDCILSFGGFVNRERALFGYIASYETSSF